MPPARRCWLLAALGLASLSSPAAAQDDFPGRDRIVERLHEKIDADALPIEHAIRFGIRGNDLAVSSEVKPADGAQQIQLRGLRGNTRVQVGRRMRGGMALVPYFELVHSGPASNDGSGSVQTSVFAQGNTARISRTVNVADVQTVINLNQESGRSRRGRGTDPPSDERVTLTVRFSRVAAPNPPLENLKLTAASFVELLRRHPGPAARYLAPMFREFGQDMAVFAVDPYIAWQLFPNAIETDPVVASKVLALVDRLNSDDFRQREGATAELSTIGGPATMVLSDIDRDALSPEQNTRIDAVLSCYDTLDAKEVAKLLDDAEFLLRCFTYSELEPIRAAAARALARKLGEDAELDASAKFPARVRAAEMMRERMPGES